LVAGAQIANVQRIFATVLIIFKETFYSGLKLVNINREKTVCRQIPPVCPLEAVAIKTNFIFYSVIVNKIIASLYLL